MKKIVLASALIFAAISCSSDDGGGDGACRNCEIDVLGENVFYEYCDNGDGTVTITSENGTTTENMDGVSFSQYIAGLEVTGFTCN